MPSGNASMRLSAWNVLPMLFTTKTSNFLSSLYRAKMDSFITEANAGNPRPSTYTIAALHGKADALETATEDDDDDVCIAANDASATPVAHPY